jgi:TonB family protein
VIKATLFLWLAGCLIRRLRGRSAAERHLLWAASLAAASILPLLTVYLPGWQPSWMSDVMAALPASFNRSTPWTVDGNADVVVRAIGVESTPYTVGDLLLAVWIIGMTVSMLRLGVDAMQLSRLSRIAEPVGDRRRLELAGDVAGAVSLRRPFQLLRNPQGMMPVTWGSRRPCVLLPACADKWNEDRVRHVLAHELAHIARHDWIVHVLAELACAVYWFNPFFWIAKDCLCQESEQAADDVVLEIGADGSEYAGHLLDIVRAAQAPLTMSVAMARPSRLEQRLAALLNDDANRRPTPPRTQVAAVGATMLIALPVAAVGSSGVEMSIAIRTSNLPAIAEGALPTTQTTSATSLPRVRLTGGQEVAKGETRPEIVEYTTPPLYSDQARQRGIEGVVAVGVRVEANGRVSALHVIRGLGSGLDQNAIVACRQWRFRPGTRAGTPVAMDAEVDVEFALRNDEVNALIANDMATRVGPGVTPPQAIRVVSLKEKSAAHHGTVVLDVVLLEDGTPKILRILQPLDPALDERALRTFEQWRFSPATKAGRPVKVRMNAEVRF